MSGPAPQSGRRRRRRRRGTDSRDARRGLYLLPQLFTTGNLFFGFFSIVQATSGNFEQAAFGIVFAGIFDTLDGRVARLSRATSRFGEEYDSLADVVSFGVAPAMLVFEAGNLAVLGRIGWVLAFVYTACAALRLARFNVSPSHYRGRFEGLPSPAGAGTVASTTLFVAFLREQGVTVAVPELLVAIAVATLGLLMVSPIPYRSFKEVDVRHPWRTVVLAILGLTLIVVEPAVSLFMIGFFYVPSGPLEWVWRALLKKPLEELPAPLATEPTEETPQ